MQGEINAHEGRISAVYSVGEAMIAQGHYGNKEIEGKLTSLKDKWAKVKVSSESTMKFITTECSDYHV